MNTQRDPCDWRTHYRALYGDDVLPTEALSHRKETEQVMPPACQQHADSADVFGDGGPE